MSDQAHDRLPDSALPPPPGLSVESRDVTESSELVLSFPLEAQGEVAVELTGAQREIVEGLLSGLTNVEIARRRGVSHFTVANQVAVIFAKFSVHSRLGLALLLRRAAWA